MEESPRFLRLCDEARTRVKEISANEVARRFQRRETFFLIDVREESEWARAHVKGASHIGKGILERDIERSIPDLDADIVLYCRGGFRSLLAADNLQRMGYTNVRSMSGGFLEWRAKGLPVE
jgi:rhodanese-related sulfurtransferase